MVQRVGGASTYDGALGRCVTPWFVIAGKHPEVAPADELLVVHTKDWVIRVEEIWMKDDLDPIMRSVE